jgi:hypothetical protein
VTCGAGTVQQAGACVPAPECGAGTHLVGLRCVVDPVDGGLGCGVGTHVEDCLCVPDQPDGGLPGSTSWSANVRVAPPEFAWTGEPEVAIDSQGRIFVAVMSNRGGYNADSVSLFRSTDHGRTFQTLGEEHPGANQFLGDTTVVVDGADRLFWGWTVYDSGPNGGIEVVLSLDGNTLGLPQRVSDADPINSFCDRPWLSVNPSDGATYVSWTNGAGDTTQGARFTQSIGGQPFASPQQNIADPNPSLDLLEESPLAFDPGGAPIAGATLYVNSTGAGSTEILRKAGGAFAPSQVSALNSSSAVRVDQYVNLRSDGSGHLTLAYLDVSSRRVGVYTAHSMDGSSWSTATSINEGTEASNAALPWLTTMRSGSTTGAAPGYPTRRSPPMGSRSARSSGSATRSSSKTGACSAGSATSTRSSSATEPATRCGPTPAPGSLRSTSRRRPILLESPAAG